MIVSNTVHLSCLYYWLSWWYIVMMMIYPLKWLYVIGTNKDFERKMKFMKDEMSREPTVFISIIIWLLLILFYYYQEYFLLLSRIFLFNFSKRYFWLRLLLRRKQRPLMFPCVSKYRVLNKTAVNLSSRFYLSTGLE